MTKSKTANTKSNRQILIDLLAGKNGASLDQITTATGWLRHSARAALTGLRKAGYEIDSEKVGGERRYRIAKVPAK
jgi:biotin operon repressor